MASEAEIQRVRKDPDQWRPIHRMLLRLADANLIEDRHVILLDSLEAKPWLEELSYLQAEWLLDIRDGVQTVSSYRGYSASRLLQLCYESRFGLDEEAEEWVVALKESGRTTLRRSEAARLFALARRLGEIESDWAA